MKAVQVYVWCAPCLCLFSFIVILDNCVHNWQQKHRNTLGVKRDYFCSLSFDTVLTSLVKLQKGSTSFAVFSSDMFWNTSLFTHMPSLFSGQCSCSCSLADSFLLFCAVSYRYRFLTAAKHASDNSLNSGSVTTKTLEYPHCFWNCITGNPWHWVHKRWLCRTERKSLLSFLRS